MLEITELAKEMKDRLSGMGQAATEDKLQVLKEMLMERTGGLAPEKRLEVLTNLKNYFAQEVKKQPCGLPPASSLAELARIILGRSTEELKDMEQEQILKRLQDSMTTIFETLNQIVQSLHAAAGLETGFEPEKTIRMLIHERLSSRDDMGNLSIQAYLDHIKMAFEAVRQAFEQAMDEKTTELLHEMAPDKLAHELGDRGIKLGPLYKASLFDLYEDRFNHLKDFVEKGLFTREVMLAFERRFSERLLDSMGKTSTT